MNCVVCSRSLGEGELGLCEHCRLVRRRRRTEDVIIVMMGAVIFGGVGWGLYLVCKAAGL